jgi:1-acyl-sn-glycerol-3-phosphate acyltransferase
MEGTRTYFYRDPVNDEFSGIEREKIQIDQNFKYINHNPFWRLASFFVYRVIMTPYSYLYLKLHFGIRYVNRKCLKGFHDKGYFLYGNHTNVPSDGMVPSFISFPQRAYVIVSPENLALKGTKNLMQMIGAFPTPTTLKGMRNFLNSLEKRSVEHNCIAIYPEAHIWPFYTKIRPFKSDSFRYPVLFNDPSFCFTVTYQKRRFRKIPRMTVYVDGPFYPDRTLSETEQKEKLHDEIIKVMQERSKNSNYDYCVYKKAED